MSSSPHPPHDGESGFVLLAVIVLVVLLLISLAVAAPKMARAIQRDKELEAIHRGEQYRLAIKLYYQKFGAFPTSVDQLLNTNNMRFLRQRYKDPITGKDDWKPVLFGQAHVKPLGFFGKPLSAVGGIAAASGAVGGGITPGMYAISSSSTDENGNSATGNDNTSGSTNNGSAGTPSSGPGLTTSPMGGGMFSSGSASLGSPAGGLGSTPGLGATASPGATGLGAMGGSSSAPMFGGSGIGPIVGFTLPLDKPSLIDYMEQTAYNKWEFNYDPAADRMQQAISLFGGGGTTMNTSGAPPSANNMGFGPGSGANGSGSPLSPSSGSGNSATNSPAGTPQSPNPDSQPQ